VLDAVQLNAGLTSFSEYFVDEVTGINGSFLRNDVKLVKM